MVDEVMFSSADTEWCTPDWLFNLLDNEFHFELDAASTDVNAKCLLFFDKEDNALDNKNKWHPHNSIFVNPPYGRDEIYPWVEKAFHESQKGCIVVMLLPARTDTAWFHDWVLGRAEIRFLRGRIKFANINGDLVENSAPFPSIIVIFKPPYLRGF